MGPCPAFTDLPTELLEAIFLSLDPPSIFALARTSRLIKSLTIDSPVVWRHLCRTGYTIWAPHHNIASKYAGPLGDVDWRTLYMRRRRIDSETKRLIDHVVATQHKRIRCINEIAEFGGDAKETLLRECRCPDDADDMLARRYYANAALERINRETAIGVWKDLHDGRPVSIDRALGAYDMFARGGEDVDFDVMAEDLDRLVSGLLSAHPDFHVRSTRARASMLALYMREQGFQGVPDTSYRALRNSFIGLVLQSPTHQSLPLISVALFCALAQRVGLDARPCGFLFHVYCLVYAPKQHTLDGVYKPSRSAEDLDFMYLDPFRSSDEVRQGDLLRVLRDMGVPTVDHPTFLSSTTTREMVLRTARNIMNSVQTIRQTQAGRHGISTAWLTSYPDMDSAFYATIWAMLVLGPGDDGALSAPQLSARRRQYLPYLLEHFQTHAPWDVALLEQYVIPLFYSQPEGQRLLQFVQSMHQIDVLRRPPIPRSARARGVRFRVGTLFRHRRYAYEGVITGWDTSCGAGEEWIQNMGVDRLRGGREQAFYHVL